MARIQPFCRANDINIGYFSGTRVIPRSVTDKNNALLLHNNHFSKWKSERVGINQANKELKDKFKVVDNFITEENVISHFKNEFIPNKIDSHLKKSIVYDLETHNTDRARSYCFSFYRLSKFAGRCNRDFSKYDLEKCKIDTFVFDGDDCITKAIDFSLKFKGEEQKVRHKSVDCNLQLHTRSQWIWFRYMDNNK